VIDALELLAVITSRRAAGESAQRLISAAIEAATGSATGPCS
jgi:hypothetical protein